MKIVYCLISSSSDIYFEQCLMSVYSLRLYHPDAEVIVLMDDKTKVSLSGWRQLLYKPQIRNL